MRYATDNKSIGLRLTANDEVRKSIYYILDDIFVSFYDLDLRIEDLTG